MRDRLHMTQDRPEDADGSSAAIGLETRIETPENVVLTYRLAGPAIRAAAYLIDLFARWAVLFAAALVVQCAGLALPGLSMGLFLLLLFLQEWGYFVICETFFRGKSLGKHALGLRVIQQQGHPISFWPSLLRNLARAADAMALYGPAFLSMVCTRNLQRLGDLLARTIVIEERRITLPREPVIVERIEPLPREEIGSFVPDARTLALIDRFLGRRHVLTHGRGHALARVLARPLAKRMNYQGDGALIENYPMAFLARVYVTFATVRSEEDEEDLRELRNPGRRVPAGAAR